MNEMRLNKAIRVEKRDLKHVKGGVIEVKCGCECGEVDDVSNVDSSNVGNKHPKPGIGIKH